MSDLHKAAEEALKLLERWTLTIDGEWGAVRSLEEIEAEGDLPVEMVNLRAALAQRELKPAHAPLPIEDLAALTVRKEYSHVETPLLMDFARDVEKAHGITGSKPSMTVAEPTRDDILRILQECGFGTLLDHPIMTENMVRFAALVAAAEREACVEVSKRHSKRDDDMGAIIAAAIRARLEKP